MACKNTEHLRGPHSTIKANSPVLPCAGLKKNYEACVSVQLGSFYLWAAIGQELKYFYVIKTCKTQGAQHI